MPAPLDASDWPRKRAVRDRRKHPLLSIALNAGPPCAPGPIKIPLCIGRMESSHSKITNGPRQIRENFLFFLFFFERAKLSRRKVPWLDQKIFVQSTVKSFVLPAKVSRLLLDTVKEERTGNLRWKPSKFALESFKEICFKYKEQIQNWRVSIAL